MIWDITFKDKESRNRFESMNYFEAKLIHDHFEDDVPFDTCNFYYDMGYLGYAEAEEMKEELKELGVIELNQICLCDVEGHKIISSKS